MVLNSVDALCVADSHWVDFHNITIWVQREAADGNSLRYRSDSECYVLRGCMPVWSQLIGDNTCYVVQKKKICQAELFVAVVRC